MSTVRSSPLRGSLTVPTMRSSMSRRQLILEMWANRDSWCLAHAPHRTALGVSVQHSVSAQCIWHQVPTPTLGIDIMDAINTIHK